jgi:hypothetical protein
LVCASRGVETNAYNPLLEKADAWATVDIVSGASAGGINGVLLGKALATGADLGKVRSLWVEGGDFVGLLRSPREAGPPSLLRSDRFESLVAKGLASMEQGAATAWPLVDVFDLFAPGTRIRPYKKVAFDDLKQAIEMREYRKIFHLKFRKRGYNAADPTLGYDQNDFRTEMNRALGEVIRATSAFPVAFEPKRIVREDANTKLFTPGEPDDAWFSDGGILHNRPFTETLATIFTRAAERPVSRWLLSVEPDPEHFKEPPGPEVYPEAPEVAAKALTGIPRYQSIAGDLDNLATHRARVERAQALLRQVDEIIAGIPAADLEEDDRFKELLSRQLLSSAYRPLRVEALVALLGEHLLEAVEFERARQPASVVRGVRDFAARLNESERSAIDAPFELRRIYYLLERLRAARAAIENNDEKKELAPYQRELWAEFDHVQQLLWEEFHDPSNPRAAALQALLLRVDADLSAGVAEALQEIRPQLEDRLVAIRNEVEAICARLDDRLGQPWPSLKAVFRRYQLWDLFILPIDRLAGAGERDLVRFVRVSPEAATYIEKSLEDKLAGDALRHFGGFARRAWRQNDILWGRLDAAEVLVRLLLEDKPRGEVEQAIQSVQEEIMARELPNASGDYKYFLENEYDVGSESLADISSEDRANFVLDAVTVTRNLLGRLGNAALPRGQPMVFRWAGRLLGFALGVVRWPAVAIWGRDPMLRRLVTLVLLFLAGWAVLSVVLVLFFDIAEVGWRFWSFVGIALLVFAVWVVLRSLFARRL